MGALFIMSGILFLLPSAYSQASQCNDLYRRYSADHTFCLPPNKDCQIQEQGVDSKTQKFILDFHNYFRSFVASGLAKNYSLPPAKNMVKLQWDDLLADLAQAHANQCKFEHECNECRKVEAFTVGQNLCATWTNNPFPTQDWRTCIQDWFNEANVFDPKYLNAVRADESTGHFTQMTWAETFRVGCGYTQFTSPDPKYRYQLIYACDYGPAGNILGQQVYQSGKTCNDCSPGTCCGTGCVSQGVRNQYTSLCESISPDGPPVDIQVNGFLWTCLFNALTTTNCQSQDVPPDLYKVIPILTEGYKTVTLKSKQTANTTLTKVVNFRSNRGGCVSFRYMKGPNVAGETSSNAFFVIIKGSDNYNYWETQISDDSTEWFTQQLTLNWAIPFTIGFSFSVPSGAPDQYLSLSRILVYEGKC